MKARTTQKFDEQYAEAPRDIQRAFDRKLVLLLKNLRHPSLRAVKMYRIKVQVLQCDSGLSAGVTDELRAKEDFIIARPRV